MVDVLAALGHALAERYTIDRELGRGAVRSFTSRPTGDRYQSVGLQIGRSFNVDAVCGDRV